MELHTLLGSVLNCSNGQFAVFCSVQVLFGSISNLDNALIILIANSYPTEPQKSYTKESSYEMILYMNKQYDFIPPKISDAGAVEVQLVLIWVKNIWELNSRPVSMGASQLELALKD